MFLDAPRAATPESPPDKGVTTKSLDFDSASNPAVRAQAKVVPFPPPQALPVAVTAVAAGPAMPRSLRALEAEAIHVFRNEQARRDEGKSRAKERILSFRDTRHRRDPRNQRPGLWRHFNGRIERGQRVRAFPPSNWTEADIWSCIHLENIPL